MRKQSPKAIEDLRDNGYCNGKIDWFKAKEMNMIGHTFYAKSSKQDFSLAGLDITTRDFFQNSKKNCACSHRPRGTTRKSIEYTIDIYDDPVKFASDDIITLPIAIRVSRNLYFYKAVRDVITILFESGLLNYNPSSKSIKEDGEHNYNFLKIHDKKQEYSTLLWDQLYPGFYLWFAAAVVCIIVFIGEIITYNLKRHIMN